MDTDRQLADSLRTISRGDVPGNDPAAVPGFGPGIDPDGFNNGQITFDQEMAGFGDATTGGGDSISTTLSLWNPYGTALYDITNKDTQNLGAY